MRSLLLIIVVLVPVPGFAADDPKDQPNETEKAVIDLTNKSAEKEKLPPLKISPLLMRVARAHSENMAKTGTFDHVIDGKNMADRLKDAGYRPRHAGENIAMGKAPFPPAETLKGWMNSPPHKANILNPLDTEIGVGMARTAKGEVYYTQIFAVPLPQRGERKAAVRGPAAEDKEKKEPPKLELTDDENALLEMTNKEREKQKLPPLKVNAVLCKVARGHSANMAKQMKMEHVLDGKKPGDRTKEAGYRYEVCGENVGFGEKGWTLAQMMKAWMESKVHRDNILHKEFMEIGVGIGQTDKGTRYFTLLFATPFVE